MYIFLFFLAFFADSPRSFRVSAVQESQIWIEAGLLDGLQEGMESDVYYEITIAGQKKRIIPAKARMYKVEDRNSIATLHDQSGVVNVGYNVSLVPRPAADLLTLFNTRAQEVFALKDYSLAKAYYGRILETLPGDPFAIQKIRDCDAQLEKVAALARERRNVSYYKQVIRASLDAKDPESVRLAQTYVEKILAVLPGDSDALRYREQIERAEVRAAEAGGSSAAKAEPEKVAAAKTESPGADPQPPIPEKKPGPEKGDGVAAAVAPAAGSWSPTPDRISKDMILIPEDAYSIGSAPNQSPFANELPRHVVHIASFYLDKYEVTNEDYKRFCDVTGRGSPSYFPEGELPPSLAREPVAMVSWIDADAYCSWAGKRLPLELEWESAAAGPSGRTWPWGDEWEPNLAATRELGETELGEVGSHPSDVSPFGAFDMAGNVSEWTADWYKPYPGNTRREKEYGEQFKVLRGGSVKASKEFARAQFRARLPDGFRSSDLGFRCAISVSAISPR